MRQTPTTSSSSSSEDKTGKRSRAKDSSASDASSSTSGSKKRRSEAPKDSETEYEFDMCIDDVSYFYGLPYCGRPVPFNSFILLFSAAGNPGLYTTLPPQVGLTIEKIKYTCEKETISTPPQPQTRLSSISATSSNAEFKCTVFQECEIESCQTLRMPTMKSVHFKCYVCHVPTPAEKALPFCVSPAFDLLGVPNHMVHACGETCYHLLRDCDRFLLRERRGLLNPRMLVEVARIALRRMRYAIQDKRWMATPHPMDCLYPHLKVCQKCFIAKIVKLEMEVSNVYDRDLLCDICHKYPNDGAQTYTPELPVPQDRSQTLQCQHTALGWVDRWNGVEWEPASPLCCLLTLSIPNPLVPTIKAFDGPDPKTDQVYFTAWILSVLDHPMNINKANPMEVSRPVAEGSVNASTDYVVCCNVWMALLVFRDEPDYEKVTSTTAQRAIRIRFANAYQLRDVLSVNGFHTAMASAILSRRSPLDVSFRVPLRPEHYALHEHFKDDKEWNDTSGENHANCYSHIEEGRLLLCPKDILRSTNLAGITTCAGREHSFISLWLGPDVTWKCPSCGAATLTVVVACSTCPFLGCAACPSNMAAKVGDPSISETFHPHRLDSRVERYDEEIGYNKGIHDSMDGELSVGSACMQQLETPFLEDATHVVVFPVVSIWPIANLFAVIKIRGKSTTLPPKVAYLIGSFIQPWEPQHQTPSMVKRPGTDKLVRVLSKDGTVIPAQWVVHHGLSADYRKQLKQGSRPHPRFYGREVCSTCASPHIISFDTPLRCARNGCSRTFCHRHAGRDPMSQPDRSLNSVKRCSHLLQPGMPRETAQLLHPELEGPLPRGFVDNV